MYSSASRMVLFIFQFAAIMGLRAILKLPSPAGPPRGQLLPSVLEARPASGGDVAHLVLEAELPYSRDRVTAPDDARRAPLARLCDGARDALRAPGEGVYLEYPHRAVPEYGSRGQNMLLEELHGARPDIQPHLVRWYLVHLTTSASAPSSISSATTTSTGSTSFSPASSMRRFASSR